MSIGRWSRGTLLLLLAAAQAFAATGQLLHLCRMREEPRACHCPHKPAETSDASAPGATLEGAACCDRHVVEAAQAPVTFERQNLAVFFVATPPPSPLEPPALASRLAAREQRTPPSHGPPLYLRVRSLLI